MLGSLFSADPAVQSALVPVLIVVAVTQPLAGYVFVLDGVLIGAGDGRFLAESSHRPARGVRAAGLLVAQTAPRDTTGLVLLWLSFAGAWMAMRAVSSVAVPPGTPGRHGATR